MLRSFSFDAYLIKPLSTKSLNLLEKSFVTSCLVKASAISLRIFDWRFSMSFSRSSSFLVYTLKNSSRECSLKLKSDNTRSIICLWQLSKICFIVIASLLRRSSPSMICAWRSKSSVPPVGSRRKRRVLLTWYLFVNRFEFSILFFVSFVFCIRIYSVKQEYKLNNFYWMQI